MEPGTATTHYAELKVLRHDHAGVESASCEFNVDSWPHLPPAHSASPASPMPLHLGASGPAQVYHPEGRRPVDAETSASRRAHPAGRAAPGDGAGEEAAARLRREMEETAKASQEYKAKMEAEQAKAVEKAQAEARAILDEARDTADQVFKELNDMRRRQRKEEDWQRVNDDGPPCAAQPQRGGGWGRPRAALTRQPGGRHGGAGEDGLGTQPSTRRSTRTAPPAPGGDSEDHRQAGEVRVVEGPSSPPRRWPGRSTSCAPGAPRQWIPGYDDR